MTSRTLALLALLPAYPVTGGPPANPFQASDRCLACHNGVYTQSGEDISIGFAWRSSMMANSSRDPYWRAAVRREMMDHPAAQAIVEDECSICHLPMARYLSKMAGHEGKIFSHLPLDPKTPPDPFAADGVSCALCHRISQDKLGSRESFAGGFVIDKPDPPGDRPAYGPFAIDAGRARIMSSSSGFRPTQAQHIQKSEVCATCHTLITQALGPQGQPVGELPEQVPYLEWLHSGYREKRSCQDCHMPVVREPAPITSVLGVPRDDVSRHHFLGGNFFVQRMLNRFRAEAGAVSPPQELEAAALRTVSHLQNEAARVGIDSIELRADRLDVQVSVENLGGHKLPTAYPSRRVWLHFAVRDRNGRTVFESGAVSDRGSIEGNDNDADPLRFEPHFAEITGSGQVQIYEAIMADSAGAVTTGLLRAVRYLKDNRLLPHGFEKRTADKDVAVMGSAAEDADFTGGGDGIRYLAPLNGAKGPFQVEVEVCYQSIGRRWAENLRSYDAEEPRRFIGFYDSMAKNSALVLARASATR